MTDSPAVLEVAQSAQRRQLTVMFCDLVDSTPLAGRLDPEDMTEVYRAFRDACAGAIQAAGGHVAKYMGDGILAYFGFPRAHEDDAERAVHAATAIAQAVPRLSTVDGEPLGAKLGIATGLVIIGDVIGETAAEVSDVVGETPNFASRLQGAAGPNEILVSDLTQRLAAGLFAFENMGRPALKGMQLTAPVWKVVGAKPAAERFHARQKARPMMGRQAELETLLDRWRACQAGGVQLVGVVGQAGMGKSRLAEAFHRAIAPKGPHIWLEGGGTQIFGNTPFHPLAQAIHRRLAEGGPLRPEDLPRRLERSLKQVGAYSEAAAAALGELIEAKLAGSADPRISPPERRRRAMIDAGADWLLKSAERWPTVLLIEDLQWVDPSTVEFLRGLIARAGSARLLILYTSRPEEPLAWPTRETRIELGRLDRESVRNLIVATAPKALAPDLLETVVARSGGVPLFAEELAQLAGEERPGEIPSALSDLLMARLDQLGPAKELAQVAAVLGGDAPLPLLGVVAGIGEEELRVALDRLVAESVMVAGDQDGQPTYAFRHALIEAAAYGSLLKKVRRGLHKRAAQAMLERFPEIAERRPEVLAQHWLRAGDHRNAVTAWRRAARLAYGRYAMREAIHACEQGVAVIRTLKATPELERDEIALQNMLANAARNTEGYASPRVLAAIERAKVLAEHHGGVGSEMERALGEWAARSSVGDDVGAERAGDAFVDLARAEGGPAALGCACMVLLTRYRQGDLASAEQAYQEGKPFFDHPDFVRRAGALPHVFGSAAIVAWLRGSPEAATRRSERGMTLTRAAGNPYNIVYATHMAAQLTLLSGAPAEAAQLAADSIRLAEENGLGLTDLARVTMGRANAALGRAAEGAAMIEAVVVKAGRKGSRGSQTMYLTWLAETHAMAGDEAKASAFLEEALTHNPREIFFRPETLRIRGDLFRTQGRADAAEADYRQAAEIARSMGAATLEQRALSSLAGLKRT
jgi:class 3 adenylate cyclase/tetratricopeptide (TPR) repeat protein